MAREIKITERNGEFNVRNIPDAVSRHEAVMAARWQQDREVKAFALTPEAAQFLRQQAHVDGVDLKNSDSEFYKFLCREYDAETVERAI